MLTQAGRFEWSNMKRGFFEYHGTLILVRAAHAKTTLTNLGARRSKRLRARCFAPNMFAPIATLAFVPAPCPNRLGRPTSARGLATARCAVTLVEIFQPPGCQTSDETTRPLLLFLPGIDGAGLAGASQWPRLRAEFSIHALRIPPQDRTRSTRRSPSSSAGCPSAERVICETLA